jgi:hypothetical protein
VSIEGIPRARGNPGLEKLRLSARHTQEESAEALLTKPIEFGALRNEIDMRVPRNWLICAPVLTELQPRKTAFERIWNR